MTFKRRFHLGKPLVDIDADAAHAAATAKPVIVIATGHEITALGIETVLEAADYRVERCSHEHDLLCLLDACRPDIVMLSENIVGWQGARTVSRLRARDGSVAIIVVLEKRDAMTAADLLELKADGILSSATCARRLIDCVSSVQQELRWIDPDILHELATMAGSPKVTSSLTSRESDVANLVLRGWHNKQIARELHLSEGTVKMHLHHIYEKLHIDGRTQLALSMTSRSARSVSATEANAMGSRFSQVRSRG